MLASLLAAALLMPHQKGSAASTNNAQSARLYGSSYALVIGVDRYPNLTNQLRFAVQDATDVAKKPGMTSAAR